MTSGRQIWLGAIAGMALMVTAQAADEGSRFRTVAEIEAALNPLEFLLNHDGVRRSIDLDIRFAFASDRLEEAAHRQLEVLGTALSGERLQDYDILLIGHTDAVGAQDYNKRLAEMRAEAVRAHLIEQYGITGDRLQAEGRGAEELLSAFPQDAAEQRRVEVVAVPREGVDPLRASPQTDRERRKRPIEW